MKVIIDEIVSQLLAVDGDIALNKRQMDDLLRAVLVAVDDREFHRRRMRSEQSLMSVRDDMEQEVV